jgi:heme/copper-type cytochrome/quinol oxidase subunit 1
MKRRLTIALLIAGVVCAGAGIALAGDPFAPASFGWTAYSPLSNATYQPVDLTWLAWTRRIGLALLALGAGSAGAALSALVLIGRRPRRAGTAD